MKVLKNKKGFTLIELLAVIVVLAIIMVIATTQINSTIRKSRANSFYESAQMIENNAEMVCAQSTLGAISETDLTSMSDYSTDDLDVDVDDNDPTIIYIDAVYGGQFANTDIRQYYCDDYDEKTWASNTSKYCYVGNYTIGLYYDEGNSAYLSRITIDVDC